MRGDARRPPRDDRVSLLRASYDGSASVCRAGRRACHYLFRQCTNICRCRGASAEVLRTPRSSLGIYRSPLPMVGRVVGAPCAVGEDGTASDPILLVISCPTIALLTSARLYHVILHTRTDRDVLCLCLNCDVRCSCDVGILGLNGFRYVNVVGGYAPSARGRMLDIICGLC